MTVTMHHSFVGNEYTPRQESGTLPHLSSLFPTQNFGEDRKKVRSLADINTDVTACFRSLKIKQSPERSLPSLEEQGLSVYRDKTPVANQVHQYNFLSRSELLAAAEHERARRAGDPSWASRRDSYASDTTYARSSFSSSSFSSRNGVPGLSPSPSTACLSPGSMSPQTPRDSHGQAQFSKFEPHSLYIDMQLSQRQPYQLSDEEQSEYRYYKTRSSSRSQIPSITSRRRESDTRSSSTNSRIEKHPCDHNNKAKKQKKQGKPHFNHPYTIHAKLLIIYMKVDSTMTWDAQLVRYTHFIPLLLGNSCNDRIEKDRETDGINGVFYRWNEQVPALTPDGVRLVFDDHGREYTRAEKQRDHKKGLWGKEKGVVERYPEWMLYLWEDCKIFIPEGERAEMYEKARRYSQIRAQQRAEMGVPQWTPDNEDLRVVHTSEKVDQSRKVRLRRSRMKNERSQSPC